ncbi:MAG: hypothetical protein NC828_04535 [Candidatus Omnitrophica bacterium]|nr:hypothetical protein [Candidatus Omnitrophota bacterium]
MKKHIIISCTILIIVSGVICSSCQQKPKDVVNESKITVKGVADKGMVFVGTKREIEDGKKGMEELTDPAYDIATTARKLFREGKYDEAEKEAIRAIDVAKHHIVIFSAHQTLLRIYEATVNYEAAIKEIDWLLKNVADYVKPELLQKREKFQEMLSGKAE